MNNVLPKNICHMDNLPKLYEDIVIRGIKLVNIIEDFPSIFNILNLNSVFEMKTGYTQMHFI